MTRYSIVLAFIAFVVEPAFAQGTGSQKARAPNVQHCCTVATQPSSTPYADPLGQAVPLPSGARPYWYGRVGAQPRGR